MLLKSEEFKAVKQSLPTAFHNAFKNEKESLIRIFPLLVMVCNDKRLIMCLQEALKLPSFFLLENQPHLTQEQLYSMCQSFKASFTIQTLVKHSLPLVLGEFPIHTRPINTAIEWFNQLVENYHRNANLDSQGLEEAYLAILTTITEHGSFCYSDYVWQLLLTLTGWSSDNLETFFKQHEAMLGNNPATTSEPIVTEQKIALDLTDTPVELVELGQNYEGSGNPFVPNYHHNINRAGRLANETYFLLLNAFGMKIGGHFDAQVHYTPRLIPLNQLHSMITRQLSHRLEVPQTPDFQAWLELALNDLGVQYIQTPNSELYVIPFLDEPLNSLTPEKIQKALEKGLVELASKALHHDTAELKIIAHYLFELLEGFQIHPNQALGIGANWDGTVNLSNEAGAYPFKFIEEEAQWGQRFKQLSLHRQGPAEVYMNAAKGINYEFQALIKGFHHMSQLKPSEHKKILYNALVDNLMADLSPEPAYFENPDYPKYRKGYTVKYKDSGESVIECAYVPCGNGTYFKDKEGQFKQTPMYRRAGTLDVQAFPKNIACSAELEASYAGNPLGPLRLQYLQSLHTSTRGHVVYNPLGRHAFLPDVFYGQVIRSDNGDLIPFTGVVPKNLDKYLELPHELCASFVLRMLLSARLMAYCPTFREACNQIKTRFLPGNKPLPTLPNLAFSTYIIDQHQTLERQLNQGEASFSQCENVFFSLFKNIVYHLYSYGKEDEHFRSNYHLFINNPTHFHPINKATCEKIIRYLTVNTPVWISPYARKGYEDCLGYLHSIVQYFYPIPCDQLAKQIALQARIHTKPLLNLAPIKTYFSHLKTLKNANLSPCQTPGMVYATLKYGGPSKAVFSDYRKMHTESFLSYYRDPEGMPYGEPQTHENWLDLGAKLLGASLQLAHKYNLFAIAREPLVQPYLQAREMAAQYRNQKFKALWITLGGFKGFFWNGVCKGTWLTCKTPVAMTTDLLSLLNKSEENAIENHALAISAAPSNEANWKVNLIAKSKDFILHLITSQDSSASPEAALIHYGLTVIAQLYSLSEEALEACRHSLQTTFPLNQSDLSQLFNPFSECLDTNDPVEKQVLLHLPDCAQAITKDLLHAVFKCIVEPSFSEKPNKAIEEGQSFWKLTKAQNKALKTLIALYVELPAEHRQQFYELFKFEGKIHHALIKRDKLIHRLQIWISNIYDERWILQMFHAKEADSLNEAAQADSVCNPSILEKTAPNRANPKDNAQSKWQKFAEREHNHQMLESHEVDKIFDISVQFLKKYPGLVEKLHVIKETYHQLVASDLSDNVLLEKFYHTTLDSLETLEKLVKESSKTAILLYENPLTIMRNFLDLTMNVVVNSRLDTVDFFSEKEILPNPLTKIGAIASWLHYIKESTSALHSLLEQQRLNYSVDEALWRIKYLLQILELQNSHQPIKKTGLQRSLRIWCQHKDNITSTGEIYTDSKTGELVRSNTLKLFSDSPTLAYARDRVVAKLSPSSIVRR